MAARYDIAVIGGGVIGSAVAYFLAADADFDGRIAVIERDPSYEACSTTRSAGSIRQQFSTPENIAMSLFGRAFLEAVPDTLAVDGERPDLGFVERGYLFLASEATRAALEAAHEIQRAHGADNALLDPDALAARFPWLTVDGIALASLGLSGGRMVRSGHPAPCLSPQGAGARRGLPQGRGDRHSPDEEPHRIA